MATPDLSVAIGFRDWGVERLRRSVASMASAMGDLHGEIIISDYGSSDPSLSRDVAEFYGARWVSTPGDPVWSRSRALNAGLAVAKGRLLISTDADMLFAPGTFDAVHSEAMAGAPCAVFLQCRDLPEDLADEYLDAAEGIPWTDLERRSRLRPRWGMGGLMAMDRDGFSLLHGYDERLQIYGREDLDFALRARRSGRRIHWVSDSRARMYHMWHPPTLTSMEETDSGRQAMARNRQIVDSDKTTSRNLRSRAVLAGGRPLVSIIVTDVTEVEELHRTLATALAQTVPDIEVLVCDRGQIPLRFDDPRLRSLAMSVDDPDELTAALAESNGSYVAVVRSGDLLPLDRTEKLLTAVVEGFNGAVGETVRLEDDGSLVRRGDGTELTGGLARREVAGPLVHALRGGASDSPLLREPVLRMGLALAELAAPTLLVLGAGAPTSRTGIALEESSALPLRAILPADRVGAVERTAIVSRLDGHVEELDLDGTIEHEEVTFGHSTISGGLTVRGASYTDLAVLAQMPGELAVGPSTTLTSGPSSSWLGHVIDHAVSNGAELPLALHLEPASEASLHDQHRYVVHSAGQVLVIDALPQETPPALRADLPTRRPWMLVGAEIEEVWA